MDMFCFKYIYEELKLLYGLVIDKEGCIFINGKDSNNVYILLIF